MVDIFRAATHGYLNELKQLVEYGTIQNKDRVLSEAISRAAEYGQMKAVVYLVGQGAKFQSKDYEYRHDIPIVKAARYGHNEIVKYLVENTVGSGRNDAIVIACENGFFEIVEILVDNGVNFRVYDDLPFRLAVNNGHHEIVKYLLDKGADVQSNSNHAIRRACALGRFEFVKYLAERGADLHAVKDLALCDASERGVFKAVKYLVELVGADVLYRDNNAIKLASGNGHNKIVKYLVEKGADFRAQNEYSMKEAIANGHLLVVKYLFGKGADIRTCNHAILTAERKKFFEVIFYLLSVGAPSNILSLETLKKLESFDDREWSRLTHSDFLKGTDILFETLFLGIQRLETTGKLPLAHQSMLEDILECWTIADDITCPLR